MRTDYSAGTYYPTTLAHFNLFLNHVSHKMRETETDSLVSTSGRTRPSTRLSRDSDNVTFVSYQPGNLMDKGLSTPELPSVLRVKLSVIPTRPCIALSGCGDAAGPCQRESVMLPIQTAMTVKVSLILVFWFGIFGRAVA